MKASPLVAGAQVLLALFAADALAATPAAPPSAEAASASTVPERGLSFGLRTGWAVPFGRRYGQATMGHSYDGLFPVWLDVGYRVNRRIYVGGYFQYGILLVSSGQCEPPLESCSGHDIRAGANVHLHFRPGRFFDPWAGVGAGYEVTTLKVSGWDQNASRANAGFEYVNLQAGADFPVLEALRLGPFLALSIGEYGTETVTNPGQPSRTYDVPSKSAHYLLFLGLRGQYDL